jgi:hypothetical protein
LVRAGTIRIYTDFTSLPPTTRDYVFTAWIPTTKAMYWEMLEILPPRAQTRRAFLVGEPLTDNAEGFPVYSCFKKTGDDYHAKNMTLAEFRNITAWEMTT